MRQLVKTALLSAMLLWLAKAWAADGSSLKLPPRARVAVVMFEDLECPDWARAYPVTKDTAQSHHIPVVLLAFPLPKHSWAFQAALFAQFFDSRSQRLGDEYRGYIAQNQKVIEDEGSLRSYTKKFAADNKIELPVAIDPEGKLVKRVKAEYGLGQKIGLEHTPTIFVIDRRGASTPFVEAVDRSQLAEMIETMQKRASPATPSRSPAGRKKAD